MGKYSLNPGDTVSSIALPVWPEGKLKLPDLRGIERSTFIINPEGMIAHAWRKVRVKGHVEDVLNTLGKLQA